MKPRDQGRVECPSGAMLVFPLANEPALLVTAAGCTAHSLGRKTQSAIEKTVQRRNNPSRRRFRPGRG